MPPTGCHASYRALSPREFVDEVYNFSWTRNVWRVDMHHTWYPAHADYRGLASIEGMARFHVGTCAFDDIAQHVTIAPDGLIWTGRDWNKIPASVGYGMNVGAFMFEMVGNFDTGHDRLEGEQLESVLTVVDTVQRRFRLPVHSLLFHREVPQTDKTCPGSSIDKLDILKALKSRRSPPARKSTREAAVA